MDETEAAKSKRKRNHPNQVKIAGNAQAQFMPTLPKVSYTADIFVEAPKDIDFHWCDIAQIEQRGASNGNKQWVTLLQAHVDLGRVD